MMLPMYNIHGCVFGDIDERFRAKLSAILASINNGASCILMPLLREGYILVQNAFREIRISLNLLYCWSIIHY